jgi:hypothetical protein
MINGAKREGREEIILKAIEIGLTNDVIKQITGLSDKEINDLRNQ